EFVQNTAGFGWDGPRIVELDGIGVAVPPPSNPPPSDPPPSDPPPSDPPPSDPPPSEPPPSNPPPSDPPPSNPPPSEPPPSNPPPSEPPPSNPPPSDPPPSDPPPSEPPPSNPPPPAPVPPVIVAQPQSVTANYAMPVALTVQATVTGAPHYQWFKDGAALADQTTSTLWIPCLTAAKAGVYNVTITDEVATVTSSTAIVALETAHILPAAFDLWDARLGSTITAMTPYVGVANGVFGAGSAAESTDVTFFADGAQGAVHVVEWSTPNAVQVNTIRLFARCAGGGEFGSFTLRAKSAGSATFDITVGTFTPLHPYTLLDASTYAILDTEIAPVTATAFRAEFSQYGTTGPRVLELDAFTTRPLVTPAVVVNPVSQIAQKGQDLALEVVARGGSLKYQWKRNGVILAGQTSPTLTILNAKKPDEGSYTVVVSNSLGSTESSPAILEVNTKPAKFTNLVR
ncbi:MAG TPA: immunoglobulin domain-containing protein, partial [Verrucomicrobiae bacterium]|nr:immunoglobulin domain-containing protein [Verrucomicrobiae bacterium]